MYGQSSLDKSQWHHLVERMWRYVAEVQRVKVETSCWCRWIGRNEADVKMYRHGGNGSVLLPAAATELSQVSGMQI